MGHLGAATPRPRRGKPRTMRHEGRRGPAAGLPVRARPGHPAVAQARRVGGRGLQRAWGRPPGCARRGVGGPRVGGEADRGYAYSREPPTAEVRGITLLRGWVNRGASGLGFPRFHLKRLAPQRPHRPLTVGAHRAALAAPEAPRLPAVTQGHDLDGEGVLASPRLRSIPHPRSIFGPHRVPTQGRIASPSAVAGRRRGMSSGDGVAAYSSNVEHIGASPECGISYRVVLSSFRLSGLIGVRTNFEALPFHATGCRFAAGAPCFRCSVRSDRKKDRDPKAPARCWLTHP